MQEETGGRPERPARKHRAIGSARGRQMIGVIEAAAVIAVVGVVAAVTVTRPGGGAGTGTASAAATRVTAPVIDPPMASDPVPSSPAASPDTSSPPASLSPGPAASLSRPGGNPPAGARPAAARPATQVPATRAPVPAPTGISHDSFATVADLSLNGSAHRAGTALELTADATMQAGSAWSGTRIDPTRSFATRFRLALLDGGADGMGFVVQSAGSRALGTKGGGLGYASIAPSVDVEFDTYRNPGEPDGNHVAVTANGNMDTCMASRTPTFRLAGAAFSVWIDYRADTHTLAVSVDPGTSRPATRLLVVAVDLARTVGTGPAYVGFTAATGDRAARQQVLSWYLSG